MTRPVRTVNLSKTYEVRTRKGLFKSEKRSIEDCPLKIRGSVFICWL
jgi:hypothetical protein